MAGPRHGQPPLPSATSPPAIRTRMKYLDLTCPTLAEDLALDEALLESVEADLAAGSAAAEGVLRVYESPQPGVVLGFGNRAEEEVNLAACAAAGVPVGRRISGGGTVVLGPGCLAYTLVLPIREAPELESVTGTNRYVMERLRQAMESAVGSGITLEGHTDLAWRGRKFSGNAQRRRRHSVLFHGTLLHRFDLPSIARWLREPALRPAYRGAREHLEFVTNLEVPVDRLKAELREAWAAHAAWSVDLSSAVAAAVAEKYGRRDWSFRR